MSAPAITEADILKEVIAPERAELPEEAARSILSLRFSERARQRIQKLLQANNHGKLASEERAELDKYLRVGQFLDLLQAKARISLARSGGA
ncbi:MAG: hypothetical protein C5B50_25335 [Verrucomicrobia bacterium]|nr:MAG: hypothetical protein C5B50_25335 [Verrucomicrobiota bacterium]